jgi:hypothetical protein
LKKIRLKVNLSPGGERLPRRRRRVTWFEEGETNVYISIKLQSLFKNYYLRIWEEFDRLFRPLIETGW